MNFTAASEVGGRSKTIFLGGGEAVRRLKFISFNVFFKTAFKFSFLLPQSATEFVSILESLVAGAWTERKKMYHGGSFLKLADDNMDIQNPEAQNRELSGF